MFKNFAPSVAYDVSTEVDAKATYAERTPQLSFFCPFTKLQITIRWPKSNPCSVLKETGVRKESDGRSVLEDHSSRICRVRIDCRHKKLAPRVEIRDIVVPDVEQKIRVRGWFFWRCTLLPPNGTSWSWSNFGCDLMLCFRVVYRYVIYFTIKSYVFKIDNSEILTQYMAARWLLHCLRNHIEHSQVAICFGLQVGINKSKSFEVKFLSYFFIVFLAPGIYFFLDFRTDDMFSNLSNVSDKQASWDQHLHVNTRTSFFILHEGKLADFKNWSSKNLSSED
jgi:hypothetical protein